MIGGVGWAQYNPVRSLLDKSSALCGDNWNRTMEAGDALGPGRVKHLP